MSIEAQFSEILLVQLKRLGLPDAESWHTVLNKGIRIPSQSPNRLVFTFSGLGINDRVVAAIVDSMVRLAAVLPPNVGTNPVPHDWTLNLNGNRLVDSVAGPLCFLLRSCSYVTRIELTGNSLTEMGLTRLHETCASLAKRPVLVLDTPNSSVAGGSSAGRGSNPGLAQRQMNPSGTTGSAGSGTSSSIDIAVLRKRREKMFHDEGITTSEEALARRDSLREEVFGSVSPVTSAQASPMNQQSQHPPQQQQQQQHQQQQRQNQPLQATPATGGPGNTQRGPQGQQQHQQGSQQSSQRSTPQPVQQQQTQGQQQQRQQPLHLQQQEQQSGEKPIVSSVSSPRNTVDGSIRGGAPPSLGSTQTINIIHDVGSQRRNQSNSQSQSQTVDYRRTTMTHHDGDASAEDGDDNDSQDIASTVATETPDEHDYLDLTMNLGPLDQVANLPHQSMAAEELLQPGRFANITVINIAQNGLDYIAWMPPTLVRLDASSNLLTEISGLENCPMLSVLNLRRNAITTISGLNENLNLTHLFLGRNKIRYVDNIAHLWMLEVLDLSYNNINKESEIRPLSLNPVLRHLMLEGNPLQKKLDNRYKAVLRNLCTPLLILDATRLGYSRHSEAAMKLDRSLHSILLPHNTSTGAPTGYAAPGKVASSMAAIRHREESMNGEADKKKKHYIRDLSHRPKKRVTREEVVAKLQQHNQSMIEAAVVERLSQQGHSMSQSQRTASPSPDNLPQPHSAKSTSPPGPPPQLKSSQTLDNDEWRNNRQQRNQSTEDIFLRNVRTSQDYERPGDENRRPGSSDGSKRLTTFDKPPPTGRAQQQQPSDPRRNIFDDENATPQAAELSLNFEERPNFANSRGAAADVSPQRQRRESNSDQPYPLLSGQKGQHRQGNSRQLMSPGMGGFGGAASPQENRHVKFSPIRYDPERTDVSIHANTPQAAPRDHRLVRDDDDSSVRPSEIWVRQLADDLASARVALRTLVVVLEASSSPARGGGNASPGIAGAKEQQRCIDIIKRSGMTDDTDIPVAVVQDYDLTQEELNDAHAPPPTRHRQDKERAELLRQIHTLGETKTCLRYMVALVENQRWDLVSRYTAQLRSTNALA